MQIATKQLCKFFTISSHCAHSSSILPVTDSPSGHSAHAAASLSNSLPLMPPACALQLGAHQWLHPIAAKKRKIYWESVIFSATAISQSISSRHSSVVDLDQILFIVYFTYLHLQNMIYSSVGTHQIYYKYSTTCFLSTSSSMWGIRVYDPLETKLYMTQRWLVLPSQDLNET